jgi:hypothetical protein
VLAVVLSVVCCKISSVASVVARTIFLLAAVGINSASIYTYITIRNYAKSYLTGAYLSMYSAYEYMNSDRFELAVAFAMIMVMLSSLIYFVLSITSIVSLAAKPKQPLNYNSEYYDKLFSGAYANNQWNNQNTIVLQNRLDEEIEQVYYDENGVKQLGNGRRVLKYDVMTGQPIYADEEQTDNESKNTDIL